MPSALHRHRTAHFSLPALVEAIAELLDRKTAPDARTLRYYQTLGLLDPPSRREGRHAVYGYRHLLQAVAIKRLQEEGLRLDHIGRMLRDGTLDALEAMARSGGGGSPPATPPTLRATLPEAASPLVARELAPGVLVTLDRRLVAAPEDLLARLARVLERP